MVTPVGIRVKTLLEGKVKYHRHRLTLKNTLVLERVSPMARDKEVALAPS
jgi:hypothetical protein